MPNRPKNALTLMEVVVGLVLLAGLMTSLLLAIAQQQKMASLAEHRQTAVYLADSLLARWMDSEKGVPLRASGSLVANNGWFWRTTVARQQFLFGKSVAVVQLEIIHDNTVLLRIETLSELN